MPRLHPLCCILLAAALLAVGGPGVRGAETFAELDGARIAALAALLPAAPRGFGAPIGDRAWWAGPAVQARIAEVAGRAPAYLGKAFPPWDDDAYLEFSRQGTRPRGEAMQRAREAWLAPLVLAECQEDRGRFLPAIITALTAYADEPTWAEAAHDRDLGSFQGRRYQVDLRSAQFAADLAQALYLLGDRVPAPLRQRLADAIHARVLAPLRASLASGKGHWWLGSRSEPVRNNWNAVCLAGAVGAALALVPERKERAVFAAAGEHYIRHYLNSYRADGYLDEGGGYWAFGFAEFAMLREELHLATGGAVDLFADPRARLAASFGPRFVLTDRQVPPFSDCRWGTRLDRNLVAEGHQALGLRLPGLWRAGCRSGARLSTILATPSHLAADPAGTPAAPDERLRTWFADTGVLLSRPDPATPLGLAVAIKAGGNGSHSHNDIGSYAIALGTEMPAGDPGGPFAYDAHTFGPERFIRFKTLNSYGHPVPVVAGSLQRDATTVTPRVLRTDFGDGADEVAIDLTTAYDVPGLRSLVRTLRHERGDGGRIILSDAVELAAPAAFATALTTHAAVELGAAPDRLALVAGGRRLDVRIASTAPYDLASETITELGAPPCQRIAITLREPTARAEVRVVFTPGR